ncbi:MAG TPA: hypothetical protein VKS82_09565 [Streptosporangiaceae bacterium]|nr:hypothetical protein [Streptosporangiaceae bacterium]
MNLTDNGGTYIPNFPAPERAYGNRYGEDDNWMPGTPGTGMQPKGPNNPKGDVPGIPVMSLSAAVSGTLAGPQPG